MVYADNDCVYSYIMEGISKNVRSYEKYVSLGSISKYQPCFIFNYSGLKELFKEMFVNCFKVSKTGIFIIVL